MYTSNDFSDDRPLPLEQLKLQVCVWIQCDQLRHAERANCIEQCSYLVQTSPPSSQLVRSLQQEPKSEFRRQVDAVHSCIEARCHNIGTRHAYETCIVTKCIHGLLSKYRRELASPNDRDVTREFMHGTRNSDDNDTNDDDAAMDEDEIWRRRYELMTSSSKASRDTMLGEMDKRWASQGTKCLLNCEPHRNNDNYSPCIEKCL